MKKLSKVVSLLLIVALSFSACGSTQTGTTPTEAPTQGSTGSETAEKETPQTDAPQIEDTSLTYITERGSFILGLDASFPPMGFTDDDLNIVGYDIDVATEVAKRMGVELVLQPIDWKAKEQELNTMSIDCIWNGFSYSTERDETLTLSQAYMNNTQVVVVLADSEIVGLDDLEGKIVAIQNGSTASEALDNNEAFTASLKEVIKVDDNIQAMMDLKISGSDAVVMDEVVARYYTEQEPGAYRVLEDSLSDELYVIGFRKGEEALRDEVEKYLLEIKEDGTLASITEEWFGKDISIIE